MRVSSTSSTPVVTSSSARRAPQQERSTKRVETFLSMAEILFEKVGYEAATMTAVAERSGASIGTLYNYFPDKQTLAEALLERYRAAILQSWTPLLDNIGELSYRQFAEQLVTRLIDVVTAHPAYLQLSTGPFKFRRDHAARQGLRSTVASALRKKSPELSRDQAMLSANLLIQILRGLKTMYTEASPKDQPRVVTEFQGLLALYLKSVFAQR